MYSVSQTGSEQQHGFSHTYRQGQLSVGVFFPIEAFAGDTPAMTGQMALAQQAEALGFKALWLRDVPLRDPSFGDVGQVFDPWVYLGFVAAHTRTIALGTASIILPLRHPLHVAKAAASVDQLSDGRLLLGVASGDRPLEYPAFNIEAESRGERFVEAIAVMKQAWSSSFAPVKWSQGLMAGADLIPKPTTHTIPLLVTGNSRQSLDWIARNSDGWISYPRAPAMQKAIVEDWQQALQRSADGVFKPFTQSLYIDLDANPDQARSPIHLGYRLGRHALVALLHELESLGVNHVILNLKYGRRPAEDVLAELGSTVLPQLQAHQGVAV
jgi:luciferase-type oxidoreductase